MAGGYQLKPTLRMSLSQRLAITPALLQKIELLTLSRLELSDLLNQELAENPVLEELVETLEGGAEDKKDEKEEEVPLEEDFDYEYFFDEYLSSPSRGVVPQDIDERSSFELFVASPSSLSDHLNWQLNLCEVQKEIHDIAYFTIGNLDEDGYLTLSVEEISQALGVESSCVEGALRVVQSLDPVGVASCDLRECLLIQIRAAELGGSLAEKLVVNYLGLIQQRKFKEISKELGCDVEEISHALEIIRSLSPRPGQRYNERDPVYIEPDVYIYKVGNDYQIDLNDNGLPKLRLNRAYRELLRRDSVSKETKSFIKERLRSAVELLKSVDQRQQTIHKVCTCILNRQRGFVESGIMHLKPMLIKDVAEELEVHSSTISRVVANKYAHTPQGVIELRKFFTVGVESVEGESLSIVHVKEKIKRIIANENTKKPLSDQKITQFLNQKGIQITRRTVAKYRDQVRIPGSRERRTTVFS